MGVKLIPPGQGRSEKEYYVRFERSMYGGLHVDNTAHTVSLVPLKRLNNIPVCVEPWDPYKLCGVRCCPHATHRTSNSRNGRNIPSRSGLDRAGSNSNPCCSASPFNHCSLVYPK